MNETEDEQEELDLRESIEEDDDTTAISPLKRRIYTDKGDPEIESLYGKYKRGKLILQPDFQRNFVWDVKKSISLLESALLDIPIPVIYLSEEKDGKEYVIDGQQRLTAFFSFIDGKFPDGKDFKFKNSILFPELNNKPYIKMDDIIKDKIRYCKIRTIIFKNESDPELKFEIFKRLNTGAVKLNEQELRNCIYRGPYNELLKTLSKEKNFMDILGLKSPHKRMIDVELVLRFAAFYHATYLKFKPPIKNFLNKDMVTFQNISKKDDADLKSCFKKATSVIKSMFGQNAFKRFNIGTKVDPNGKWQRKKFNTSLYDILMHSLAQEDKNKIFQNLDAIREALIDLMTNDEDFIRSIEISTSSVQAVRTRFDKWRFALKEIIGVAQKEPRCFSLKLKEDLYKSDSTCKICNQKIQILDDSAIDHIDQYWKGGKTIPENARLTHRFCNWARSRKE